MSPRVVVALVACALGVAPVASAAPSHRAPSVHVDRDRRGDGHVDAAYAADHPHTRGVTDLLATTYRARGRSLSITFRTARVLAHPRGIQVELATDIAVRNEELDLVVERGGGHRTAATVFLGRTPACRTAPKPVRVRPGRGTVEVTLPPSCLLHARAVTGGREDVDAFSDRPGDHDASLGSDTHLGDWRVRLR